MFRAILVLCCITMLSHQVSGFAVRSRVLLRPATQRAFRSTSLYTSTSDTTVTGSGTSSSDNSVVIRQKVKKILESDESVLGTKVTVQGWVRTVRDQKKFSFIEINDGSTLTGIQAVAVSDIESYSEVEKFTTGAAVEVVGTVIASIGKGTQIYYNQLE